MFLSLREGEDNTQSGHGMRAAWALVSWVMCNYKSGTVLQGRKGTGASTSTSTSGCKYAANKEGYAWKGACQRSQKQKQVPALSTHSKQKVTLFFFIIEKVTHLFCLRFSGLTQLHFHTKQKWHLLVKYWVQYSFLWILVHSLNVFSKTQSTHVLIYFIYCFIIFPTIGLSGPNKNSWGWALFRSIINRSKKPSCPLTSMIIINVQRLWWILKSKIRGASCQEL